MTVQSNPQHSPTAAAVNLTPNTPISTELQILGEGIMAEWLLDHQISAVYVSQMTIASVDVWVDYAKKVLQAWPTDKLYCALTDLSAPNVRMTPYSRTRTAELGKLGTNLTSFAAVILASNIFGQILRPFINSFPHPASATIKIFFSRAEGLAWLERMIVKYGKKP